MPRDVPFDKLVARGLLEVIGQAGQTMSQARGRGGRDAPEKDSEKAREPRREPRRELTRSEVPVDSAGEDSAERAGEAEGDLASRRLFALLEQADQGEAAEPQPAEPQPAELQPAEPQPAEPQPAREPAPAEYRRDARTTIQRSQQERARPEGDTVAWPARGSQAPAQDLWRRFVAYPKAKAEEDASRVVRWLEARLAAMRPDED